MSFSEYHFGGTAGCNTFGGLGLLADQHFAIHSWSSTLIGCHDEMGRQEQAISKLFFARPRVTALETNRVRIASSEHKLELERVGSDKSAPVPAGPQELTNTNWQIVMMDGEEASANPTGRILSFSTGKWRGMASCATLYGTWRRHGDRLMVDEEIATTEQNCRPDHARIDKNFADLMRSSPRYLVGPNGELLIAGGGHALAGGRRD